MKTLEEKKLEVLRKFYGGERAPYMHNFRLEDGICKYCRTFIGDTNQTICRVITPDEVALFRGLPS